MTDSELVAAVVAGPGGIGRPSKVGVAIATSTTEVASCSPTSTTCSPHFMCWWTISLPVRTGAGRRPRITDAELITLAVAQILLQCHSERRFLRLARKQLGHLFAYIPLQPGYSKRLRALAPQICEVISHLARISPSFCDRLRLLDCTPVPCGQSRETAKRSELAGWASYGWCASHSRYFWGGRRINPTSCAEHTTAFRTGVAADPDSGSRLEKHTYTVGFSSRLPRSDPRLLTGPQQPAAHAPSAYSLSPPASGTAGRCGSTDSSTRPAGTSSTTTNETVKRNQSASGQRSCAAAATIVRGPHDHDRGRLARGSRR